MAVQRTTSTSSAIEVDGILSRSYFNDTQIGQDYNTAMHDEPPWAGDFG
jgi:hypothetical protein